MARRILVEGGNEVVVYDGSYLIRRTIGYIFGIIEIILGLRLFLRLTGANPGSRFVAFIYSISEPLVAPFRGIFPNPTADGAVTTSVFETSTLVALIIYPLLCWAIVKVIAIATGRPEEE